MKKIKCIVNILLGRPTAFRLNGKIDLRSRINGHLVIAECQDIDWGKRQA
jgi:hypothetical protein